MGQFSSRKCSEALQGQGGINPLLWPSVCKMGPLEVLKGKRNFSQSVPEVYIAPRSQILLKKKKKIQL